MSPSIINGLVVPGNYFPIAYAIIVATGLVMALVMGMRLHFDEIVKTHCGTAEYWPSISATTGDFTPERFIWRTAFVVCALFRLTSGFLTFKFFMHQEATAGSRSGLVSTRTLIVWEGICEVLRCVTAVGWTIISSGEDNLHHNASFGVYMIVGFVLQVTQVVVISRVRASYSASNTSMSWKKLFLVGQSVCAMSVAFFYVRHHQTCAAGAYSRSTMCEWMFALFNILFDASQAYELHHEHVTFGSGAGEPHVLKLASVPSEAVMWISDTFFGYFIVSSFIATIMQVYFIPMVAMEMTWEVALVFSFAAPTLYYSDRIRNWASSRVFFGAHGYVAFYFVAIVSLFSIDVRHDAGTRIWTMGTGCIFSLLAFFGRMYHSPQELTEPEARRNCFTVPLGFALSMGLRLLFASLDPLYNSPLYNGFLGIVFGSWCAWIQYRRSAFTSLLHSAAAQEQQVPLDENKTSTHVATLHTSPVLLGVCFASVFFYLSMVMVSSSGFIARLIGLEPWPSGIFVIAAFLLGLYLSPLLLPARGPRCGTTVTVIQALSAAPVLCALLIGGWLVLTYGTRQSNRMFEKHHAHYPTTYDTPREFVSVSDWSVEEDFRGSPWLAFCGGLAMVVGIGASFPAAMDVCFNHYRHYRRVHPPRLYKSLEMTYSLLIGLCIVAHVYVVCFPFVPAGFLLKDRMDMLLLGGVMGTLIPLTIAVRHAQHNVSLNVADAPSVSPDTRRTMPSNVLWIALLLLVVFSFGRVITTPDSTSVPHGLTTLRDRTDDVLQVAKELGDFQLQRNKLDEPRLSEAFRRYSIYSLEEKSDAFKNSVTKSLGPDVLYAASHVSLYTAMIWTIHFGIDNFGVQCFDRMVAMIRETGAGVVGLLESDAMRIQTGNRDVVEYVAYSLGYDYTDHGPTTYDATFGCALITKYPILYSRRYVLPSPLGELACLIHAKLDLLGVETHVYVGHWGNTDHWADGILQSQFLAELVQKNPGPSIFLGYLVTKPGEEKYNMYTSATEPGKFRDTALQLYKARPWRRLTNLGGYVESVSPQDQQLPEVDQQYHRPPEGADPRYFFFEDTQRYSTAHPRWEYMDRYCQYILYKSGLAMDEKPEDANRLQPYHFELVDWWRVLEIHNLSDTEIQVVQLALRSGNTKPAIKKD